MKTKRRTTRPRGFAPWTPQGDSLETVQCEAIPPDELARILKRAILDRFDPRGLQGVLSLETGPRKEWTKCPVFEEQRTKLVEHVSDFLESLR